MICDAFFETLQYQENLLTKYYLKQGHEVVIIASTYANVFDYYAQKYDSKIAKSIEITGKLKIIKLPFKFRILNKLNKFSKKSVMSILTQEKPDLIYIHDIHLNILEATKYVRSNKNCKMIMDYHADYYNSGKNWLSINILHKIIRKYFLMQSFKYLSGIFPVVPSSTKFLNEVYGIPLSNMELLPLGADLDLAELTIKRNPRILIREKLKIPDADIVIFTGGKLSKAKQTHKLIEALRIISNLSYHVLIIGKAETNEDYYYSSLRGKSVDMPNVHFLGWLGGDEVYDYLNASDIAVFPASQSVLWQQALSMGLPLIVGDVTGNNTAYLNINGAVVLLKDEFSTGEYIAKEIIRVTQTNDELNKYKLLARETADKLLNYDKIVARTMAVRNIQL